MQPFLNICSMSFVPLFQPQSAKVNMIRRVLALQSKIHCLFDQNRVFMRILCVFGRVLKVCFGPILGSIFGKCRRIRLQALKHDWMSGSCHPRAISDAERPKSPFSGEAVSPRASRSTYSFFVVSSKVCLRNRSKKPRGKHVHTSFLRIFAVLRF